MRPMSSKFPINKANTTLKKKKGKTKLEVIPQTPLRTEENSKDAYNKVNQDIWLIKFYRIIASQCQI